MDAENSVTPHSAGGMGHGVETRPSVKNLFGILHQHALDAGICCVVECLLGVPWWCPMRSADGGSHGHDLTFGKLAGAPGAGARGCGPRKR